MARGFVVSRGFTLKPARLGEERFVVPPSVLAVSSSLVLASVTGSRQPAAPQEMPEEEEVVI